MDDKQFEDYVVLEPIINAVYHGQMNDHICPFCKKGELKCTIDEFQIRIECPNCGKFFEGLLAP